ncbi:MAG: membrane protein insertion efficiency factor YidD [Bacteroidetes bacterium]|nr:membrane protein insertion efficiency factor YidD [Bacteroidota bacterium]MCK6612108.1 membrane protein insertion efficiency factor YidD [Bacteroidia bacterium]
MLNVFKKAISLPFLLTIKLYQWFISPLLPNACRYTPTCSEYAIQAFQKYNLIKAFWLSLKRISSCGPWGGHGHDPLP